MPVNDWLWFGLSQSELMFDVTCYSLILSFSGNYIQAEFFLKLKALTCLLISLLKQKYIKFGSGVDWIWGPVGSMNPEQPSMNPEQPGPSSSACFDRGGSKIDFGPAMPVQVSSCTSHPAQGCLISRSDLRCTCSPPCLQRDLVDPCSGVRLEAHWSGAVHAGMLLSFIQLLLFSSFFPFPSDPVYHVMLEVSLLSDNIIYCVF
jgi:hypothetical protein